jgi:orotate phosphoribosyltransferase
LDTAQKEETLAVVMPDRYYEARSLLARMLVRSGAFLTFESSHPLIETRPCRRRGGAETGFKVKYHEKKPDAPLWPIYFNLRTEDNPKPGPLSPEIVRQAALCLAHIPLAKKLRYQAAAGVPNAGDPFAKAFCELSASARIELSKHNEPDGKRSVAGVKNTVKIEPWAKTVLMIDDLITKGDSKLEAIRVLKEASFDVTDVVVLIDYELGAREELEKEGVTLHSVFTLSEFLNELVKKKLMLSWARTTIEQRLLYV